VKALIRTAAENGYEMKILQSVEAVNEQQKSVLYHKIKAYYPEDLRGKTFALWGLSFKPKTDDMREAPSLVIIEKLLAQGCKIKAYDPVAMKEAQHLLGDSIEYAQDQYDALIDADALLIITEWPEFRSPNFKVVRRLMKEQVLFDGRNIYDSKEMEEAGFTYFSIGVKPHYHSVVSGAF
jgi:UDPglucose 6-dehydrogenase